LVRELQDFRVEYTQNGTMTFNARVGQHDDLVLALAIAVWQASRIAEQPRVPMVGAVVVRVPRDDTTRMYADYNAIRGL
jgi:hypothetical protein